MRGLAVILALGFFAAPIDGSVPENKTSSPETVERISELIASDNRRTSHKDRDKYRHPLETLTFFGIEQDMTVVEVWPGGQGSWYREIIEPLVGEGGGTYIPVTRDEAFMMEEDQVPYGQVDMVLVFRAHGFMIYDKPVQNYVDALYAMLKPGGIFGIVDHAGDETIPQDPEGVNGYVNETFFKGMAEKAGFVLLAEADFNRNPKDTKDHPRGVWSLPPTLLGTKDGTEERQIFLEIGESDRFSLKFYKPDK